jgi:ADP-ribose pyrophosphatase
MIRLIGIKEMIETIKENIVYKNKFATIYDNDVKFPNGAEGKYIRMKWNIPYGVVLIPFNSKGEILLIKEFNYRKDRWEWSVPKGMGVSGIEPKKQAENELLEEIGFSSNDLTFVFNLREVIETDKGIHFYKVDLSGIEMGGQSLDTGESIESVRFFDINDAFNMVLSGEIDCYHAAVAILYLIAKRVR